jgi:hypothetical protein
MASSDFTVAWQYSQREQLFVFISDQTPSPKSSDFFGRTWSSTFIGWKSFLLRKKEEGRVFNFKLMVRGPS